MTSKNGNNFVERAAMPVSASSQVSVAGSGGAAAAATTTNGKEMRDCDLPLCFCEKRHVQQIEGVKCVTQSWRMKERMKTVSVALVICLNVGVDPPDVIKIQPCSRLECWIDPSSVSPQKALELIGCNLQKQYERWQPRARYKQSLDPTVEDVKKLCTSLRRNAKEERVLFHYNGHGVPKPTGNGEIWVFNKNYTQYIPLSIYDLQTWMGAPSIYVYDCSNAGIIVNAFNTFAENHEKEFDQLAPESGSPKVTYKNCIQLAACAANQILPMNPQLPADLFTACLTTPIKIALKWFMMQQSSKLLPRVNAELIDKIPGQLNDRRTMLGELNWIFTAVTDTIAWNTLPRDLFQKLFRQDLLVASLFRNFLLAERILRSYDCTPISHPALPQGYRHPMWTAWDLALDLALSQLPRILKNQEPFQHSPFFEEQLTSFQVWLDRGSENRSPPEQLPIVLQVLLSQVHRLRALELLGRFLDLGPWAVNLALSVGIFPYVLKLLQSSAKELRPFLVFIWAKILAVDSTCQVDLVRDQGHKYFLSVLQDSNISAEYRTQAAFVLACIVDKYDKGQKCAVQGSLVSICLVQLNDSNWRLRQWLTICLGNLWQNYDKARWSGYRDMAPDKLDLLLRDSIPEVRAAAVYALGTFISSALRSEHANNIDRSIAMTLLNTVANDMSPIVRMELVAALQWMVILFENQFVTAFLQDPTLHSLPSGSTTTLPNKHHSLERNITPMKKVSSSSSIMNMSTQPGTFGPTVVGSIYTKLWQGIVILSRDPYPDVARLAQDIMEFVRNQVVVLIAAKEATAEKFCSGGGVLNNSPNLGSLSLPPSPNTRTLYLGGRDREHHAHPGRDQVDLSGGDVESVGSNSSTAEQLQPPAKNPIVTTSYKSWAISQFARPSKFSRIGFTNPMEANDAIDATLTNVEEHPVSFLRQSLGNGRSPDAKPDRDAPEFLAREWRFKRNDLLRQEARDQQRRVPFNRLETQAFTSKTQHTPTLVKLHPYEAQIAVAYRDKVTIHDWNSGAMIQFVPEIVQAFYQNNKLIRLNATNNIQPYYHQVRVTSLEFVNAHDRSLILIGYDDGSLRLWRPPTDRTDDSPRLISAWPALDIDHNAYVSTVNTIANVKSTSTNNLNTSLTNLTSAPTAQPQSGSGFALNVGSRVTNGGMVMTWLQRNQVIAVGGDSKHLRLWDAAKELKIYDIPLNADSSIKTMSSARNGLIAAGFMDGSVRLFDKRCSAQEARIMTYRDHSGVVLATCLRDDCENLISGCSHGIIRSYDIRMKASRKTEIPTGDVSAISIHTMSDIVACGNQMISIYGLDGRNLGTIRTHDGFMGARIGQSACLSFHPHKVSLAAGFLDQTVSVYTVEGKK